MEADTKPPVGHLHKKRALERHEAGAAVVIPVILRPCDWHSALFGKLNATPPDGKPVTKWADRDAAFLEVAKAVRAAAERLSGAPAERAPDRSAAASVAGQEAPRPGGPRSSNLRLAKTFTERDRDRFKLEALEYIARFFENSLEELGKRNADVEGHFRRLDANRFIATIYEGGAAKARCTVFIGSELGNGICYINGETTSSNSMNESLRVEADEQAMFLRSMGMAFGGSRGEQKLSQEGAAESYWELLIRPLQRG